jgi:hypothetical protein
LEEIMSRFAWCFWLVIACHGATLSDSDDTDTTDTQAASSPLDLMVPIDGDIGGRTYKDEAAGWWQWELAATHDALPSTDPDGHLGAVGQPSDFFFLAGTSGGAAVRSVTVPAGRPLFFPILDTVWVSFPGIDPPFSEDGNEQNARDLIAMNGSETLGLEIDGVTVPDLASYRVISDVFGVTMPDWNMFDGDDPVADDVVGGGEFPECVADGFYIMLEPLPAGTHEIHFTGSRTTPYYGFSLDTTYHLTVE